MSSRSAKRCTRARSRLDCEAAGSGVRRHHACCVRGGRTRPAASLRPPVPGGLSPRQAVRYAWRPRCICSRQELAHDVEASSVGL